ncbi:transmembrane protein 43-like [Gigantopelta aegis]|uniref:transmembrane protein 43-like n=1 Tax=Gigantopelta aegis TaxID=1735272 RepID=UPI001B88930B|nr:transmembrane protein 43-like [Gigantopelta aegis]
MYRQQYPGDPGMHNMGGNSHTRVSYRHNPTFFERIGNSLVGILVGLVILTGASCLVFWNEGRAVQTAKSLDEGLRVVLPLGANEVAFDENNGKLVHISGLLRTDKMLEDSLYKISTPSVKLKRKVEMYQWVEHETKREYNEGGQTRVETTYSYSQEWSSDLIRSSSFDNSVSHVNPESMSVQSLTLVAHEVRVGNFFLSNSLVEKITDYKPLNLPGPSPGRPHHQVFQRSSLPQCQPHTAPGYVGDLRVTFEYAGLSGDSELGPPAQVSIIAKQHGRQLVEYRTEAGNNLEILHFGNLSPKEIFGLEQAQNSMLTWAIRFAGWLMMFVGFGCLTSIVTTLVDWLPIIRELVGMGVAVMNLSLSISLSLTVIALGWIRYRPWLGCAILAMALTPLFLSRFRFRQSSHSYNSYRGR